MDRLSKVNGLSSECHIKFRYDIKLPGMKAIKLADAILIDQLQESSFMCYHIELDFDGRPWQVELN